MDIEIDNLLKNSVIGRIEEDISMTGESDIDRLDWDSDDDNDEYDYYNDLHDELMYQELEERKFAGRKGCGIEAHAYKNNINNFDIITLRERGATLRQIAKIIGCSPSTVRNRLKKMGMN